MAADKVASQDRIDHLTEELSKAKKKPNVGGGDTTPRKEGAQPKDITPRKLKTKGGNLNTPTAFNTSKSSLNTQTSNTKLTAIFSADKPEEENAKSSDKYKGVSKKPL